MLTRTRSLDDGARALLARGAVQIRPEATMADDEQKAKQKAEAAAAKEAKEREKFIAKIVKEGGAPACPNGSLIPFCCGRPSLCPSSPVSAASRALS